MLAPRRLAAIAVAVAAFAAPAAAQAAYGAIAVNRHDAAWGVSYNQPSLGAAKRVARRHCRGGCRIMVWVRNRCAAVVTTRTSFYAGIGSTRSRAVRDARRRAHDHYARRLAWTCSG
jgi:hypothetical protein